MIVREGDAEALPSYMTYVVGEAVFRPLVDRLGGYAVHNAEALRPLDGQSFILSPNHRSNWDSFIVGLSLLDLPDLTEDADQEPLQPRAIHFMGKDSLWRYPVVKQFITRCGAFPVQRDRGVGLEDHQIDHIGNLIDHQAVLGIYPQGHRLRKPEDEESIHREDLKTTIAYLALKYGIPILPVGIAGPVKGRKLPRTLVFGEPVMVGKSSTDDEAAFKREKYALMDHLRDRMDEEYKLARQLHLPRLAPSPAA